MKSLYFVFFLLVLFSGCFDLVEEVTVHSNGSGSFLFEANGSQSKTKLKTLLALDSLDGFKVPSIESLNQDMDKAKAILLASDGISNFTDKRNFEEYIFSMRFDFRDVSSLNHALTHLFKTFNRSKIPAPENTFQYHSNVFERKNEYQGKPDLTKLPRKELDMLEGASFTSIYRFDKLIQNYNNPDAKLSKNGKVVFLKLSIPDLIKGNKTISNTINLQP